MSFQELNTSGEWGMKQFKGEDYFPVAVFYTINKDNTIIQGIALDAGKEGIVEFGMNGEFITVHEGDTKDMSVDDLRNKALSNLFQNAVCLKNKSLLPDSDYIVGCQAMAQLLSAKDSQYTRHVI